MSFLSKLDAASKGTPAPLSALTGVLSVTPAVVEYLTATAYPDGSQRERSTISLFLEDGVVKACLSDRDQARTLWRSGASVEDALMAVESAVADGTADWRKSGGGKATVPKRK